jgi:hypothetical protein|tara:strand:- start:340 stop:531 length:192 start_codon:yes stop_codon:yes gene_type:complete
MNPSLILHKSPAQVMSDGLPRCLLVTLSAELDINLDVLWIEGHSVGIWQAGQTEQENLQVGIK